MRLSVITDEISQEFEHALDVMLEYGVTAAEPRGLWGTNIADLSPAQVRRALQALRQRGMVVSCLATPILKCALDSEEATVAGRMHLARARTMGEQQEVLRRCAETAHVFGTRLIRVFTFWRDGTLTPEVEARICDALAELAATAEACDVVLGVENEHACFVGTGAEAARVVDAVAHPRVRVCWDPGNALAAGERPFPDGYDAVRGRVEHVHIKDGVVEGQRNARWTVVGEGAINYRGQFDALRADGYEGFVSLETHYIPTDGTPEEGSRACLAGLRTLVEG